MSVEVIHEDPRWREAGLDRLSEAAFAAVTARIGGAAAEWEVAILACDDARIAALNADFRGKGAPTNVLSWPSEERGAEAPGGHPAPPDPLDPELGDIAIAYETCLREAEEAGKPLADHVTHLIVHGVLHLLGYDHERDEDATLMEGLETAILEDMGLADPYE
ncbi:MAG: rRNA maturation RNase YbeY [Pseudooceanicola sp.]